MSRPFDSEFQSNFKKYKLLNKTVFSIDFKSTMTYPVKELYSKSNMTDDPIQIFVDDDLNLDLTIREDGIHISKKRTILKNSVNSLNRKVSDDTLTSTNEENDNCYKDRSVSTLDLTKGQKRNNSPANNEESEIKEIYSTLTSPQNEHVNFDLPCEQNSSTHKNDEFTLLRSPTPYPTGSKHPPLSHRGRKLSRDDKLKPWN